MKQENKNKWETRPLENYEEIPYDLLLLADETVGAINKYVFESNIYVLEIDHSLIATYVLYSLNENEIEIKNIAVNKTFQGKGIGRFLLQDASMRAKEKGYRSLLIGTADAAIKQLNMYQKAGFEIFDVKKYFYTNNYPEPIFQDGIKLRDMLMLRKMINQD